MMSGVMNVHTHPYLKQCAVFVGAFGIIVSPPALLLLTIHSDFGVQCAVARGQPLHVSVTIPPNVACVCVCV
jgi:hypothetical protein